jgi:hypothetical protein
MTNCSPTKERTKGWQRKVPSYDNRNQLQQHRGIENIEEVMILFGCFFSFRVSKPKYKTPFLKFFSGQKNMTNTSDIIL